MSRVSHRNPRRATALSGRDAPPIASRPIGSRPNQAAPGAAALRPTRVAVGPAGPRGPAPVARASDQRVGTGPKAVLAHDPLAAHFHEIAKRFVLACRGAGMDYKTIAREMGAASPKLVAKCLAPQADRLFRYTGVMKLLASERAPRAAVAEAVAAIARELGFVAAPIGEAEPDGTAVRSLTLEASARVGGLSEAVRNATAPESPGGEALTGKEAAEVARHAEGVKGVAHGIAAVAEEAARKAG